MSVVHRGCELPGSLWYDVERDVWLRLEPDGTVTLGLTDPAQSRSGKLLHIQFKRPGRHVEAGQSLATIETAKWAGPFPTPLGGTIVAVNEDAFRADILVANRDPYGAGWVARLAPDARAPDSAGLVTGEAAIAAYTARIDALALNCFRCAD